MKKITTNAQPTTWTLRFKGLLAAAIIASTATLVASAAQAQSYPIGLGIGLGRSLFNAASNRHRSSNYSDPSVNDPYASAGYGGYPGGYSNSGSRSSSGRRTKNASISVYNKGVKLFNAEKYDEAIPVLTQAVQIDPQMGSAFALLAVCQSKNGQLQEAMQNFETAKNTGNYHYQSLLFEEGMCAARMRDYQTSVACLQQYVSRGRGESQSAEAQKALEIVNHNFGNQPDSDYLADASKDGTRRWADTAQPLRVYINENPTLRGYHPEFAAIVKQSFDEWSQGTNGKVAFVYTADPSQAQIKVSWTDNEADLGTGSVKELGLTQTVFSDGIIESADIKLHTLVGVCRDDANELFPQAKCVALHEIGHALGLQHSSEPYDTMFPLVPPKGFEFSLTKRDLNTMVSLYNHNQPQMTTMQPLKFAHHAQLADQTKQFTPSVESK